MQGSRRVSLPWRGEVAARPYPAARAASSASVDGSEPACASAMMRSAFTNSLGPRNPCLLTSDICQTRARVSLA